MELFVERINKMNENHLIEICKRCTFYIVCEQDKTMMCEGYRLLMRLMNNSEYKEKFEEYRSK